MGGSTQRGPIQGFAGQVLTGQALEGIPPLNRGPPTGRGLKKQDLGYLANFVRSI